MVTQLKQSKITLRCWTLADSGFLCEVRNTPELQQWFRQNEDVSLKEQILFMTETAPMKGYYGFVVELEGVPIGMCALVIDEDREAEFSIGILPKYQHRGYATEAMRQLTSLAFNEFKLKRIYSDVFVHNPALSWYLRKCGFTAYGVKEKAYWKPCWKMFVDTVQIEQRA